MLLIRPVTTAVLRSFVLNLYFKIMICLRKKVFSYEFDITRKPFEKFVQQSGSRTGNRLFFGLL